MVVSSVGVVFDCDGTLLDSMGAWREAEKELARHAGFVLSKADSDELNTLTLPECCRFFHERLGVGDTSEEVKDMLDAFMLDYYRTRVTERPGALAFVRGLAERGVAVSVASSSPQSYLRAGLARAGFAPYVRAIVSVDDVGKSKREPAVYDRARELMGTPLETTWGVEDSLYALRTLRSAGYRTLAIYDCDVAGTYEDLSSTADIVIRGFDEMGPAELIERSWRTQRQGSSSKEGSGSGRSE